MHGEQLTELPCVKFSLMQLLNNLNKVKNQKGKDIYRTGAMYSSVPTKELDCDTGSATNIGGGRLLDLLLLLGGG